MVNTVIVLVKMVGLPLCLPTLSSSHGSLILVARRFRRMTGLACALKRPSKRLGPGHTCRRNEGKLGCRSGELSFFFALQNGQTADVCVCVCLFVFRGYPSPLKLLFFVFVFFFKGNQKETY